MLDKPDDADLPTVTEDQPENAEDSAVNSLPDWRLWPPSPKMQIVLIAIAFGLFNCMLLGIWAWVMIREFG